MSEFECVRRLRVEKRCLMLTRDCYRAIEKLDENMEFHHRMPDGKLVRCRK
jgi:hypothetical protein